MGDSAIDYSDLEISIKGLPRELLSEWLAEFEKNNRSAKPELKEDVLYINSDDFIVFLGYVDVKKISEMELQRLKTRARQEMERLLFNSTKPKHRYHYKWCIAALQSFEIGRKRIEEDVKIVNQLEKKKDNLRNFPSSS